MKNKDKQLLDQCLNYIETLQKRKFITPYHYFTTKEAKDGTKQQGVVPTAELAAHVLTAEKLGRDTQLTVNGTQLDVSFVEKFIHVPWQIDSEISRRNCAKTKIQVPTVPVKKVVKAVKKGRK